MRCPKHKKFHTGLQYLSSHSPNIFKKKYIRIAVLGACWYQISGIIRFQASTLCSLKEEAKEQQRAKIGKAKRRYSFSAYIPLKTLRVLLPDTINGMVPDSVSGKNKFRFESCGAVAVTETVDPFFHRPIKCLFSWSNSALTRGGNEIEDMDMSTS